MMNQIDKWHTKFLCLGSRKIVNFHIPNQVLSIDITYIPMGRGHLYLTAIIDWFRSLKTELIYINDYASPKELRSAIRDYVEQYNSIRPHQSLDYLTPDRVYGASFGASA